MTLEMVRRVNRDNVRLLYDPANSYRAVKENVPEAYLGWTLQKEARELAEEVRHMHVKDYHYDPAVQPKPFLHVPSGSGDLPYEEIFRIFRDSGWSGVCSLEPEAGEEGALLSMDWMSGLTEFF
jgi:sugar phosphate isomerase/epimerase